MPVDGSAVSSFAAVSMVGGNRGGEPYFDIYRIASADASSENIEEILAILKTSHYQPDFCNLLPWGLDSVSADRNYDSRSVTIQFAYGDDYRIITFHTPTMITVQTKKASGFCIYHPTNADTITKLVEYLQTNGTKE